MNFRLVAELGAGDISFIPARCVFAVLISEKTENSRWAIFLNKSWLG